jgi:hypothetical protein
LVQGGIGAIQCLDLLRPALDTMIARGKVMAFTESDSSLPSKWCPQLAEAVAVPTMLVPFRHSDCGWFDYNPMLAAIPMALWHHGNNPDDRRRLDELREAAGYDWRTVRSFRSKEEAGHEEPWFAFLPASTRIRLTLTLALRTRPPSYTTPFDGDLGLPSQAPASPTASQVAGATVRSE